MAQDFVIFVIDDDESVRDSLRDLLEAHQYRVKAYGSGAAFFEDYAGLSGGRRKGCVVADFDLPVLTGLQVLERLRQQGSPLPVIIITGRSDSTLRGMAHRAGAVAFLEKPFPYDALLAAIEEIQQADGAPTPV